MFCVVASVAGKPFIDLQHAKDLQTEADRTAQKHIVSSLAAHFPGLTIIGELPVLH